MLEPVRKTSAALASLSLAVLALTGCSSTPSFDGASCDRSGSASSTLADAVSVSGELGTAPDVDVYAPVASSKTQFADVIVGDGLALENPYQVVMLDLSMYSGDTGEKVYASQYSGETGNLSNISIWAQQIPGLGSVLQCATGGSRVVASIAPEDAGDALAQLGLAADDNLVVVVDVEQTFLPRAQGALQFNDARGMPTVVRAPDGAPGVIIPGSAAPSKQVVQTLIEGDGEKLSESSTPILNVTAVGWDDKNVINTTWGANPSLDLSSTAPDVAKALIGKPVGSQVLVVTPAADGASATVYVVDILGAVTTPAQ